MEEHVDDIHFFCQSTPVLLGFLKSATLVSDKKAYIHFCCNMFLYLFNVLYKDATPRVFTTVHKNKVLFDVDFSFC